MTNLDKMKQNIISQITSMDAETFLDFINVLQGQYIEDQIVDFSEIFRCQECKQLFGQCPNAATDKLCIDRFKKYASEY